MFYGLTLNFPLMNYFDESIAMIDPFDQFKHWYTEVEKSGRENHNAVALSTTTMEGSVSSRIVLLKYYDKKGFVFFTNYNSRKGVQADSTRRGAMLFYWPDYGRQVRIEGVLQRVSGEESDSYFNSRIRGHKLNAVVSPQSMPVESREWLNTRKAELSALYTDHDPPRPAHWGGYRLAPDLFEFWQEGQDRFHDRIEYLPGPEGWTMRRLAP